MTVVSRPRLQLIPGGLGARPQVSSSPPEAEASPFKSKLSPFARGVLELALLWRAPSSGGAIAELDDGALLFATAAVTIAAAVCGYEHGRRHVPLSAKERRKLRRKGKQS